MITGSVWPRIVWVSAAPCRGPCSLNWAPVCPQRRSLFSGRHSLIRGLWLYPRCPTGRLPIIVFHQRRPDTKLAAQDVPRSNRRRIKIIKVTAGFCLASSCDIHPAGNPTVRQLPGAIPITELSIQCHLASSFQLVDVAGSRSYDNDRLRSLVMSIFYLFRELPCRRESENGPVKT